MKLEEIRALAKQSGAQFIDIKFCDLQGGWHHITLPIDSLKAKLFENGVGIDGSSLPGFTRIERGDLILLPDPATAFVEPFYEHSTISFLGNIMESADEVTRFSRCPRRVATAAEEYIASKMKGVEAMFGPEFEFYVFDRADYRQEPGLAYYEIKSVEAGAVDPHESDNLGHKIGYKKGYHAAPPQDRTFDLRSQIATVMAQVGIGLKYHHHEVGGWGQHEIELQFAPLLKMADNAMMTKYIIKNEAFRSHKSVTFMPKPLFNEPGSGLHVHQFLAKAKKSIFFDAKGANRFSDLGLHYIGGVLKHVDSILAFTNPSTNSFKRMVPGFEAPIAGTYSVGNRTACIRIPGYIRDPHVMRFEFRPPDATMNPYLGFAAMAMAGLDGIKNKIDPGPALDRNLDELPKAELEKIHLLPTSLDRVLDALKKDNNYLLEGGVFTEDLLDAWVTHKTGEFGRIANQPTAGEFELYYDC